MPVWDTDVVEAINSAVMHAELLVEVMLADSDVALEVLVIDIL